jgi:hypothetical protein
MNMHKCILSAGQNLPELMAKITAKLKRILAATVACIPPIWRFFPGNPITTSKLKKQNMVP